MIATKKTREKLKKLGIIRKTYTLEYFLRTLPEVFYTNFPWNINFRYVHKLQIIKNSRKSFTIGYTEIGHIDHGSPKPINTRDLRTYGTLFKDKNWSNLAEGLAQMLIWCIENNCITKEEINNAK